MTDELTAPADRTLDVREIEGPPFEDVLAALEGLQADETVLLVNSFEPEPLYEVLTARGFAHETTRVDGEEWHVRVERA